LPVSCAVQFFHTGHHFRHFPTVNSLAEVLALFDPQQDATNRINTCQVICTSSHWQHGLLSQQPV
jgi:hypothetical protein